MINILPLPEKSWDNLFLPTDRTAIAQVLSSYRNAYILDLLSNKISDDKIELIIRFSLRLLTFWENLADEKELSKSFLIIEPATFPDEPNIHNSFSWLIVESERLLILLEACRELILDGLPDSASTERVGQLDPPPPSFCESHTLRSWQLYAELGEMAYSVRSLLSCFRSIVARFGTRKYWIRSANRETMLNVRDRMIGLAQGFGFGAKLQLQTSCDHIENLRLISSANCEFARFESFLYGLVKANLAIERSGRHFEWSRGYPGEVAKCSKHQHSQSAPCTAEGFVISVNLDALLTSGRNLRQLSLTGVFSKYSQIYIADNMLDLHAFELWASDTFSLSRSNSNVECLELLDQRVRAVCRFAEVSRILGVFDSIFARRWRRRLEENGFITALGGLFLALLGGVTVKDGQFVLIVFWSFLAIFLAGFIYVRSLPLMFRFRFASAYNQFREILKLSSTIMAPSLGARGGDEILRRIVSAAEAISYCTIRLSRLFPRS